jgi:hypothetical protein
VGSDLDLIIVVEKAKESFERRAVQWDVTTLPVPADVLVYTVGEWESLRQKRRFYQTVMREGVWVYDKQSV